MTLFRMVNGQQVQMPPDEEAATRAEWAAFVVPVPVPTFTAPQLAALFVTKGVLKQADVDSLAVAKSVGP